MKNYKELINESYKIVPDDYNYFRDIIKEILDDPRNKQFWLDTLKTDRERHINIMLAFAKHDWQNGGGKLNEFPREELRKVANEVIDEIINEK